MSRSHFLFTDGTTLEAGTIYGIGKNYAAHAREMGGEVPASPMVFLKPPAALVQDGGTVVCPAFSANLHHEVEMVVIIGEDCQDVPANDAKSVIAGYGLGLDMTLRDLQHAAKQQGSPWAVAKGFRTSAPISRILPATLFTHIPDFDLELSVNNEGRQKSSTKLMERSVATLIEYLSSVFTLRKGDSIYTGTPEGVGQVVPGDVLTARMSPEVGTFAGVQTLSLTVTIA
ncbi:MAG: fumarylacetoacetate hydrolase family protein [Candidatus Kapabacteria bacterium]|nr:fumarylacetoacetate hydrolase family protein [Candidatus Kapabacteria bacterium]